MNYLFYLPIGYFVALSIGVFIACQYRKQAKWIILNDQVSMSFAVYLPRKGRYPSGFT